MERKKWEGTSGNKPCELTVTDTEFRIQGNFYYLVDKEFKKAKVPEDSCKISEYLGLGVLNKRSPKKMFFFLAAAALLELFQMIAGKIAELLFFTDTGWTDYFVNGAALLCMVLGIRFLFSKKKVYEISFRTKRFCVGESDFSMEQMKELDRILLEGRKNGGTGWK